MNGADTDRRQKMMSVMPIYEAKYHESGEWKDISEIELMDGLYKIYRKATPAIKEMIEGKEIFTSEAVFRLKLNGGKRSEMPIF